MNDLQNSTVKQIKENKERPYLVGFGGFLYLVVIGLFLTFCGSGYALLDAISVTSGEDFRQLTDRNEYSYSLLWTVNFWFTVVYCIVTMLLVLFNSYLCYKQKRLFKWMMITFYFICFIGNVIFYFLGMLINEEASYLSMDEGELARSLIYSLGVMVIWSLYFFRSRRVKNTFIL